MYVDILVQFQYYSSVAIPRISMKRTSSLFSEVDTMVLRNIMKHKKNVLDIHHQ